uniref:RAB7A interacting MON1-CCZ1 complex subunit 1 n=1 Tax=Leptobrachium leishanense TaxID=445787 RepID=A0A8C5N3Z4_9ANUR
MAASSVNDWMRKVEQLQLRWQRLNTGAEEDAVLLKASATLQKLSEILSARTGELDISLFLNLYSKAVLDITFFEENQLVDEDFIRADSLEKVGELIQALSEPEHLVREAILPLPEAPLCLEVEVCECLHWRRGALLYMYCHTVGEREHWNLRNRRIFQQCLKDGVSYLLTMLKARSPVTLNDVSFRDFSAASLLSKGIFSDIHVLALMYCGEMCYWALKYCRDAQPINDGSERGDCLQDKSPSFQEVGEHALETYVSVCEGPLANQGWNTEKAKDLLQYLKSSKT